jgi:Holliday junction resolvase RusA-like endonuclease
VQTITLSGEPKSTQTIYRASCRGGYPTTYMTAEGKALKEQYFWKARSQWKGPPLSGNVALYITFFFATKRARPRQSEQHARRAHQRCVRR